MSANYALLKSALEDPDVTLFGKREVRELLAEVERLRAALAALWSAVKKYDRIGYEGSELLEVMSEVREILERKP